jgi:GMP synthase-like glutamine amidotransferase
MHLLLIDNHLDLKDQGAPQLHALIKKTAKRLEWDITVHVQKISSFNESIGFDRIVLSGSAQSMFSSDPWVLKLLKKITQWTDQKIPLLGICFGHQIIARAFGAQGKSHPIISTLTQVFPKKDSQSKGIFANMPSFFAVSSHQESLISVPSGFEISAWSAHCPIEAISCEEKKIAGVQFHPEKNALFQEEPGIQILKNFLLW